MARKAATHKKTGGQIIISDPSSKEPWARVPATMLRDPRISGNAIRLYAALYLCAWRANYRGERGYDGQEALAEEFGMSPATVTRALNELREAGYIETERVGLGEPDNVTILLV